MGKKIMKILVTGGAGFIGSHLVDALISKGHTLVVIDNLSTGFKKNINPKAIFYKLDICDPAIQKVFIKERPESVFHFAAQVNLRRSIDNPIKDAKTNILGSINILENCVDAGVKKVIFASTGGAMYGEANIIPTSESHMANPLSPYAINKLAIESYLNYYYNIFGLQYVSLRFSNVYGPRQNPKGEAGVVGIFCEKIFKHQNPTVYGNGRQTRDFIYVDDAINASISAMEMEGLGVYNISTSKETSINMIFDLIKRESGVNCKKIHIKEGGGAQKKSCLDYSQAKKVFGWQPEYSLKKGIINTIRWYRSKLNYEKNGSIL